MSLTWCPRCGRSLRTSAYRCPNCGAFRGLNLTTRAVIILIYLGAGCLLFVLGYLVAVGP